MERTRYLRLGGLLALVVLLYFVVPVGTEPRGLPARVAGTGVVLGALVVGMTFQLRQQVDGVSRRIDGLVVSLVLTVVVFALLFYVVEQRDPTQLSGLRTRLDALYFTAATLTTVGFGDVHATGQAARALVLVQLCFNVVYVAAAASLLSARLRAAVRTRGRAHQDEVVTGEDRDRQVTLRGGTGPASS